jgi:hypothetical protein
MKARTWTSNDGLFYNVRLQWHCKTGDWEAPVSSVGGGEFSKCTPIYSPTEPITVYADVSYSTYMGGGVYGLQTFIVPTAPHVYHYLERPIDHAPVIEAFSVMAYRGPASRCLEGHPCEAPDGAVLFNGTEGDYYPPLLLSLRASDADGDPVSVQWHCKAG